MSSLKRTTFLSASILLLSIGATAYGQVPPTNDTSDANANTGVGSFALQFLTTGTGNTAVGVSALAFNTIGYENTATGVNALDGNTTGSDNAAFGYAALMNNTTGQVNTATGFSALNGNTSGSGNMADGVAALGSNTTGDSNTASGYLTLGNNTTGNNNVGMGVISGYNITTGSNNIVIGTGAGYNLTVGNSNIDIGNDGVAGEGHTIRIGNGLQHTKAFVAGIWGNRVRKGAEVVVDSNGQLGVEESSERYKLNIASMVSVAGKIQKLRPVTYHLKSDPTGDLQYGLIAEEVDQVYPELVVRDDAGNIEGVRYDRLAPILLSEVQQQQQKLAAQAEQLGELEQQFAELKELNAEMHLAIMKLQAKESQVAMR